MVLLRILRWLLRPVSRLLYALFALVWPRRRAEREEPLTQRGNNIHLTQRGNNIHLTQRGNNIHLTQRGNNIHLTQRGNNIHLTQRGNNIHLTQRGNTKQRSQFQAVIEEFNALTELKKKKIENQLRGSENTVTALQEKAHFFSTPPPSPPPPPPPPPLHPLVLLTSPIDPLDALRKRKTFGHNTTDMKNVKARAMDETMERIKKGVVLKPTQRPPQLETKMEEKMKINNQLRVSENTVTALQEKVKQLQDMLKMDKENPLIKSGPSNEENVTPAQLFSTPPPPPPYRPLVLSTSLIDPLDTLRKSKKPGNNTTDLKKPARSVDVKASAMDEMMERIKKGVVLKPTQKPPQYYYSSQTGS